jgi:branched-chain amino acid transport system substrate-binding protein
MTKIKRRGLLAAAASAAVMPLPVWAADPIKIGFPMALSGPNALYGQPALRGAEMYVEETNAKGGVLGRKIQLISRDTKANADEAVRVSRELILKDNVDFLVGSMTSAESPAVSTIAKENKIILVAPMAKTIQLTDTAHLHAYVFRTASTTDVEGRSAAEIMAKWDVKRVATIAPDYAYGRDVMVSFAERLKKLRPDIEIVDQQWPKLGQADFTPFITAQLSKQPDAVFSGVYAGDFASMVKQAKPLGYFDAIKYHFLGAGETGSIEIARTLGADYPFGITANTYDPVIWPLNEPAAHKDFTARVRTFTKDEYGPSWAIMGYTAMMAMVEGIRKAGSIDQDKVSKAMIDLVIDTPIGPQTLRGKDHSATRSEFWGKMVKDPAYPFAVMENITYPDPIRMVE